MAAMLHGLRLLMQQKKRTSQNPSPFSMVLPLMLALTHRLMGLLA
jgi:hypothetical protein